MSILNSVAGIVNRVKFQTVKHSPEILVVAGVAGMVATTVIACKQTTKLNDILEKRKEQLKMIQDSLKDESISEEEYSEQDAKNDVRIITIQTAVEVAKLYAPAVILGVVSIGCIFSSHNILNKRNIALAAAYQAVDKGWKEYRKRIVDKFGEEFEKEIRYGVESKEVEEEYTDEKGKKKTKTVEEKSIDISKNPYAKFFDSSCPDWEKNPEYNLMFLQAQQRYANDLLISRGHLFLNEVYDMLGIERTKAGQVIGWKYDVKNPALHNCVDFGIYKPESDANRRFINGLENVILLDFNVDGNILGDM
nr:MAG TPA: hypothetical protein [Caudoviricetes sp.]